MKKIVIIFLSSTIACFKISAQSKTLVPVTFKTPEAAAFDKHVEMPVSYFTGVPSINIPLYTIKIKDAEVPISLSYHAGGIRVDEEATWVGLGFNLNFGGSISRKQRGLPDEFYFMNRKGSRTSSINDFNNLPHWTLNLEAEQRRSLQIQEAKYGNTDYMPDEFNFSALTFGGRFMFSQEKSKFIFFPKDDIKMDYEITDYNPLGYYNPNYAFKNFTLTLPTGVQMKFGEDGFSNETADWQRNDHKANASSWLPKQIKNIYGETIDFNYSHSKYKSDKFQSQTQKRKGILHSTMGKYTFDNAQVSGINFPEGVLVFERIGRKDIPSEALSAITVLNKQGKMIKKIDFIYSYFSGKFANAPILNYVNDDYKHLRLRLDTIIINDFTSSPQIYKFDYYYDPRLNAPSKYSYAQDYWGFYNGKDNKLLIPFVEPGVYQHSGADRNADGFYAKVFSLKSIKYPEGGKTEYLYEGNVASSVNRPPVTSDYMFPPGTITNQGGPYMSVIGLTRDTYYNIQPTYSDYYGDYFVKRFTIPTTVKSRTNYRISYSTDVGNKPDDFNVKPFVKVSFKLEKIEDNGSRKFIRGYDGSSLVTAGSAQSEDISYTEMEVGKTYEMTIQIRYNTTDKVNQAQHTFMAVHWTEEIPKTFPPAIAAGGLRINQIKTYSSEGKLALQNTYTYMKPGTGSTSGVLFSWPQHWRDISSVEQQTDGAYVGATTTHGGTTVQYFANSVLPMQTSNGSYLGYEFVTEFEEDFENNKFNKTVRQFRVEIPPSEFSNKLEYIVDPLEWRKGQLLTTDYYKDEKVIKAEYIDYNTITPHLAQAGDYDEYVEEINTDLISFQALSFNSGLPEDFYDAKDSHYFSNSIGFDYSYDYFIRQGIGNGLISEVPYVKRHTGFNKPSSKTTVTYDNHGNKIKEQEEYFYEKTPDNLQLTRSSKANSNGSVIERVFRHANEFSSVPVYDAMVNKNMLAPVIEQVTTNKSSNKVLEKTKTNYDFWHGNTIIAPLNFQKSVLGNELENEIVYNNYSPSGNLLQYTSKNKEVNTFLWGYKNQYPVAQIKGADYGTASGKIDQTILDQPLNEHAIRDELAKLRAIPGATVTTYTYEPLIGITSSTDVNGNTTYYEYDLVNRLKAIRDKDKNVVGQFGYNYTGQPEEFIVKYKSKETYREFTRNDCPANAFAGKYTYIVAKGKYTSTISQEDADQQALNELETKGQEAANTNAGCYIEELINLSYASQVIMPFTVKLINSVTKREYTYVMRSGGGGNLGQIPKGIYDVTITPQDPNFKFNCGVSSGTAAPDAMGITIFQKSNVDFNCTSCAYFYITQPY